MISFTNALGLSKINVKGAWRRSSCKRVYIIRNPQTARAFLKSCAIFLVNGILDWQELLALNWPWSQGLLRSKCHFSDGRGFLLKAKRKSRIQKQKSHHICSSLVCTLRIQSWPLSSCISEKVPTFGDGKALGDIACHAIGFGCGVTANPLALIRLASNRVLNWTWAWWSLNTGSSRQG